MLPLPFNRMTGASGPCRRRYALARKADPTPCAIDRIGRGRVSRVSPKRQRRAMLDPAPIPSRLRKSAYSCPRRRYTPARKGRSYAVHHPLYRERPRTARLARVCPSGSGVYASPTVRRPLSSDLLLYGGHLAYLNHYNSDANSGAANAWRHVDLAL
ncbi:hypothetical protein PENSPDRAFT_291125 [Peniophora sp. CONT]|nr:hypothetical protein PENSPDRAFT_291125 [Peniophora sp. CONT]